MSDTVFRTKIEPVVVEESKVEVNKDKSTTQVSDIRDWLDISLVECTELQVDGKSDVLLCVFNYLTD